MPEERLKGIERFIVLVVGSKGGSANLKSVVEAANELADENMELEIKEIVENPFDLDEHWTYEQSEIKLTDTGEDLFKILYAKIQSAALEEHRLEKLASYLSTKSR